MSTSSSPLISMKGVRKVFFTDELKTHALSDIELEIQRGEYVCVAGPSGCGKSTLLSILGLLDSPTEGSYWLNGQPVENLSLSERARIRNRDIGFIFQSFNLIPDLNLFDNVDVPLRYRGLPASDRKQRIENALEIVGLASRMKHIPAQLSGGQQQRVAIARGLANRPAILLADEPTGNLDRATGTQVMDLLFELQARAGTTLVLITHDPALAERCRRKVQLIDGRIANSHGRPVAGTGG